MGRKIPIILFVMSVFVFTMTLICYAASPSVVVLNGRDMGFRPIVKGGVTFVPVSPFSVSLKTYDAWYPDINTVLFNGKYFQNWLFSEGYIYVPVRELVDAVGGTFRLDNSGYIYINATPDTALTTRNASPMSSPKSVSPKSISTSTSTLPKVSPLSPAGSTYQPKLPQRNDAPSSSIYTFSDGSRTNPGNSSGITSPEGSKATVYAGSETKGGGVISPLNAQGGIGDGLRLPPNPQLGGVPTPQTSFSTQFSDVPAHPTRGAFEPKSEKNQIYSITVTNIEEVTNIKNTYNAAAGSKYLVVYISQQNISTDVQIYTGKFTLMDENSKVYDYLEGLSNYWLAILKPGGTNYGYLVFEVPQYARPSRLVLNALSQPPLAISLSR